MAYERSWTPEEYEATICELEALGFFVSRPGVMTRAAGPVPLVIDLLPTDDTRPGWVRMSVPSGALVDLVKARDQIGRLEEQNRLLSLLAKGCVFHPGYRAKRAPKTNECDCCNGVWAARQALDKLTKEAGAGG